VKGAGLGRLSRDRTQARRPRLARFVRIDRQQPRFAQPHGRPLRWPLMTEDGKPLETLLEDAARARRLAVVLHGDPAALELERYAEEVDAEIHRRALGDWGQ
jgi:hypothetical protein